MKRLPRLSFERSFDLESSLERRVRAVYGGRVERSLGSARVPCERRWVMGQVSLGLMSGWWVGGVVRGFGLVDDGVLRVMANRAIRNKMPMARPDVYEKLGKTDVIMSSTAASVQL